MNPENNLNLPEKSEEIKNPINISPEKQKLIDAMEYMLERANDAREAANDAMKAYEAVVEEVRQFHETSDETIHQIQAETQSQCNLLRSEIASIKKNFQKELDNYRS